MLLIQRENARAAGRCAENKAFQTSSGCPSNTFTYDFAFSFLQEENEVKDKKNQALESQVKHLKSISTTRPHSPNSTSRPLSIPQHLAHLFDPDRSFPPHPAYSYPSTCLVEITDASLEEKLEENNVRAERLKQILGSLRVHLSRFFFFALVNFNYLTSFFFTVC